MERGWTSDKLGSAYDIANLSAQKMGLKRELPLKVFLEAVLDGQFDEFLFEHNQSWN